MTVDFEKMNEEQVAKMEKSIVFFRANKDRIKQMIADAMAVSKEVEEWI